VRDALREEVGYCECCGHDPGRVKYGRIGWVFHVHEIARGVNRLKALDKRFALLVVCFPCHDELGSREEWPEARQLAALRKSRPHDYDLAAYLTLKNPKAPNAITQSEVDAFT